MNRILFVISCLLSVLILLTTCERDLQLDMVTNREHEYAEDRMKKIAAAIQSRDAESIYAMFSVQAHEEDQSLRSEIERLFDYIEGDIVSFERFAFSSSRSKEKGYQKHEIYPTFTVKTSRAEYRFSMTECIIDTENPDNQGLYELEVFAASNTGEWMTSPGRNRAGVSIIE